MRILALAVLHGPDVDSSYLEGLVAMDALRELGALSPEDAVFPEEIGFRRIPVSASRSRRHAERVARTEDGRAYLVKGRGVQRSGGAGVLYSLQRRDGWGSRRDSKADMRLDPLSKKNDAEGELPNTVSRLKTFLSSYAGSSV